MNALNHAAIAIIEMYWIHFQFCWIVLRIFSWIRNHISITYTILQAGMCSCTFQAKQIQLTKATDFRRLISQIIHAFFNLHVKSFLKWKHLQTSVILFCAFVDNLVSWNGVWRTCPFLKFVCSQNKFLSGPLKSKKRRFPLALGYIWQYRFVQGAIAVILPHAYS